MIGADEMKEFKIKDIQLRPLFFLQEKLDDKIKARFNFDSEVLEENKRKKELAFKVEIAELLNELNFHKYWSKKLPSEKSVILEEYADGLHFILSIGIDLGIHDYDYQGIFDEELDANDLVYIFEKLFEMPWLQLKKSEYKYGLEMYIKLGHILLFTWDEIKDAYVKKNIKNQDRQEQNY